MKKAALLAAIAGWGAVAGFAEHTLPGVSFLLGLGIGVGVWMLEGRK